MQTLKHMQFAVLTGYNYQ